MSGARLSGNGAEAKASLNRALEFQVLDAKRDDLAMGRLKLG